MPLFDITDEEIEAFLNGFEKCIDVPPTTRCAGVPPKEEKAKGQVCKSCKEFYEYAEEPNQKDGSFKCFSCRNY